MSNKRYHDICIHLVTETGPLVHIGDNGKGKGTRWYYRPTRASLGRLGRMAEHLVRWHNLSLSLTSYGWGVFGLRTWKDHG